MTAHLVTYPTRDAMWTSLADHLCATLAESVSSKNKASIALPGGSTPGPLFDRMAEGRGVPWARVTVLPTDERWLAEGHADTNEQLIRTRLQAKEAAAARFLSFHTQDATPGAGAPKVASALSREGALPLDICVLGLGEDGHVASLIVGAEGYAAAMSEKAASVAAIHAPGAAGAADRLTLSFREICAAQRVILVFLGKTKRAVFEAATLSPLRDLVARATVEAHWSA